MTRISNSTAFTVRDSDLAGFSATEPQKPANAGPVGYGADAHSIFELLPDAVMINRAAEIIYANGLCTQLLAAESTEDVVGRRVEEYWFLFLIGPLRRTIWKRF